MVVYESGIRLLVDRLPFAEIENLELTEDWAIRFSARGRTYQYAAISTTSKETPDENQTERLFHVLIALKSGGLAAAEGPLKEFRQASKANTKSMLVMAGLLVVLCALLAWLEESGCKRNAHNKSPETPSEPAPGAVSSSREGGRYDHERYFEPECWSSGAFITKKWWTTFRHPHTLTVAHLVKVVATGKWKDEDAQPELPR